MYYVYILYSPSFQVYYKGYTENINDRLAQHNAGLSRYTAGKGPWELIILECYSTKREALIREKSLKRCKSDYFEWLRMQPRNCLHLIE
jgi:putative endonuclease